MNILLHKTRKDAESIPLSNTSFLLDKVGFWGNVSEVDSTINSVNVISDTGIKYTGLPVISNEWVNADDDKNYVSASRNLPPVGARVFCLAPTHTPQGAFVLCSGYAMGNTKTQILFSSDEDKDKNNEILEKVNSSGWHKKQYYKNGNTIYESPDGEIKIELNTTEDSEENLEKQIKIEAWGNEIIINEDGLSLKDSNGNEYISKDSGIEIKDSNGNKITSSNNGLDFNGYLTINKPTGGI